METLNFIYFISNFPYGFIKSVWDFDLSLANHFQTKFNAKSENGFVSESGFLSWFYELSSDHQMTLINWVNKNYDGVGNRVYNNSSEIKAAKETLKKAGYFTENLWSVKDVQCDFFCTDEKAQMILNIAVDNSYIKDEIIQLIEDTANSFKLTSNEE